MFFTHNSNMATSPHDWIATDLSELPRNAFAEIGSTQVADTWGYPHHHLVTEADGTQTMYLSEDGLIDAMKKVGDASIGVRDQVKTHLATHAKIIGFDEQKIAELLGISDEECSQMTNDITYTTIKTGGNDDMDDNIKKLQTKVDELEGLLATATSTIATMEAAGTEKTITDLRAQIEGMNAEKLELDKTIEDLTATINGANAFAAIGKQAVDALKADVLKIAAQVDGETFDKTLTDKQIEAFDNDFEMLTKFKGQYVARRKSMFKAGDLQQDDYDPDDKTSAAAEASDYNIGRQIGGGKVIDIKR